VTASTIAALRPADSQQIFRAVLEALARPGVPMALPNRPLSTLAPAISVLMALADATTGVCVLDDSDGRWAEAITTATAAPAWPAEMARLVAGVRPVTAEEIRGFNRGSALAPEDAALVALGVADVHGGTQRWKLSGPGVCPATTIAPQGLSPHFVAARADAVGAFPAGIDVLLLTDDGRVVGLPRTTTITEEN
jgi:alpha-D-ribose 1-methylphosphonate 5-triphosphate synthase subunit PhnH